MRMSDLITQEIIKMLNESGVNTAEIQRGSQAKRLGGEDRMCPEPDKLCSFLAIYARARLYD